MIPYLAGRRFSMLTRCVPKHNNLRWKIILTEPISHFNKEKFTEPKNIPVAWEYKADEKLVCTIVSLSHNVTFSQSKINKTKYGKNCLRFLNQELNASLQEPDLSLDETEMEGSYMPCSLGSCSPLQIISRTLLLKGNDSELSEIWSNCKGNLT